MHTIAVVNQKGGVGKTTVAHMLWTGLARQGKKTLAVDLDAQGNFTFWANTEPGKGTWEVLTKAIDAKDAILTTPQGHLIASSPALAGADITLVNVGKEYALKEALEAVSGAYDVVIIDTPPALGILTVNGLVASDLVVIPALAEAFSLQGIGQLAATIDPVRRYCNPSLKIAGILLTRYSSRTVLARSIADMAQTMAGKLGTRVFKTWIRDGVAVREAQMQRVSLFDYAPKAPVTVDCQNFIKELMPLLEA